MSKEVKHTPGPYAHATPRLPFTDGYGGEAHAQREYAHCLCLGMEFAAHGRHWHYRFATGEGRTLNVETGKVTRFDASGFGWTDKARAAIAKATGGAA